MFTNLYAEQELQSDLDKDAFKISLSKITDDNINAAFENFDKEEIVEMLCQDKVWFKLSDRQLSRDCLEQELSQHNEIMLEIIRGDNAETDIERQLEILATEKVDEIIADYEVNHAS